MYRKTRLLLLAAGAVVGCSSAKGPTGTASTGTVAGTVVDSAGPLARVAVTVTPTGGAALPADTTGNDGKFSVSGVPIGPNGQGAIAIGHVPANCTTPTATNYRGLTANETLVVPVAVPCVTRGTLIVNVVGLMGVSARVTVIGPNGYSRTVTTTDTLKSLAPGSYAVRAAPVTIPDPIVSSIDTAAVTGSLTTVTADATSMATVTYAQQPGTGSLFVTGEQPQYAFVGYTAAQLRTSGLVTPAALSITPQSSPLSANANPLAFDAAGNLWWATVVANGVSRYAAGHLTEAPVATIAIDNPSGVVGVTGFAFDKAGNLWMANASACEIDELSAAQLRAQGSTHVTPALIINPAPASLAQTGCATKDAIGPNAVAFDAQGNLWVTDPVEQWIYEYPVSVLSSTGTITIEPSLKTGMPAGMTSFLLAFDGAGNLWVTSPGNTLLKYTPAQLAAGGATTAVVTTPAAEISVGSQRYNLFGLAFDNSGDLWLAHNSEIDELTKTQLTGNGALVPATVITFSPVYLQYPWSVAFTPQPTNVALASVVRTR